MRRAMRLSTVCATALVVLVLSTNTPPSDGKVIRGILSSKQARLYSGQYVTSFWFNGDASFKFQLNATSTGQLLFYTSEKWAQVSATTQCQDKLKLAQYSYMLSNLTSHEKFAPLDGPVHWHITFADSVSCDSSVPALQDISFTLELYNPDSHGKDTNHFSYTDNGLLSFYEIVAFLYFAGAVIYGQRLAQTIQKGGPMHSVIRMLAIATSYQAVAILLTLTHLYRFSTNGEGTPFLYSISTVLDGLTEYQMLTLMSKMSLGWTLGSSYSTLDPSLLKQLNIGVAVISTLELVFIFWELVIPLIIIKVGLAASFSVMISKKVTEERSSLRKDFYNKFSKGCLTWILAYPALVAFSLLFADYSRHKLQTWGILTAQSVSILLLFKLFLSRSLYWEVSSLSASTLPLRLDSGYGSKLYNSEKRTVGIHKHIAIN